MIRRNFLKIMGGGVAAAPALAKKVALDAGVAATGMGGGYGATPIANAGAATSIGGPSDWVSRQLSWFAKNGLPDYIEEQLRAEAQYVSVLDPDLAAKRSWSMSVKIQEQRERNFRLKVDQLRYNVDREKKASLFESMTGWRWFV